MVRFVLLLAGLCVVLQAPLAETFEVRPDGTGDFPTIQAAIDGATDGDIIELTNGTFSGEGNYNVSFDGKAVTVCSQGDDPELCIIDCGGGAADPEQTLRGFAFLFQEGPESVLRGITITNGVAGAT